MTTYHEFPQQDIEQLVETARAHYAERNLLAVPPQDLMLEATPMILGETCISVTVEDGKICLTIPIVDKKICFPIPPSIPNGTAAKACVKICTTLGFPTGACVTITALGIQVVHQCFGKC
ncbi:hypothetical protein RA27_09985 [Ruegeria sp. ANG-R]|uniref:hypothetical protein n=1 Tax=Ruegeria sp. ANG-R TaxID=1577903 RepID=UPI00057FCE5D|nr:hypothetical protein [Ruegeria sp. ANG-R]KIC41559.1 hypothetical protein RA27_09985 [Ruegeria sp. ANG-R]